ncbi:pilus assembly protein N-terminal domain-containing protein [Gimesia panareensis]|uniref:pilus assembly protein N-terminal domain-containing protein n=1 Tax=Gimesia panareensis TaxID=2527978 RepID=UPI00118A0A21|nr:pilus assembly protein N-terminal domain-containing protein [Gimesia panareensis]QDU52983.1 hypothetical protein Pan110_53650 [Gimesia panareensis]
MHSLHSFFKISLGLTISIIASSFLVFDSSFAFAESDPAFSILGKHNEILKLNVSQGQVISFGQIGIDDVDVADESICRRVLRRSKTGYFEVIGLKEGRTTITVWPGKTGSKPIQIMVTVSIDPNTYLRLEKFVNKQILDKNNPANNSVKIKPVPLSGKIIVEGKVRDCDQLNLVKELVAGGSIPVDRVVWDIEVRCQTVIQCCKKCNKKNCRLFRWAK